MKESIISAIIDLDEDKVIRLVKQKLKKNCDSLAIIEEVRKGVERVGELYEEGKFYIADLIMSGMIFEDVLKLLDFPKDEASILNNIEVVFATVEKDIHDVGKNITISLFRSKGIRVTDLGVDVPADRIADEVEKTKAPILCLSGLITSSFRSMKKTVKRLEERQLRSKVKVIIGGNVNEKIREFAGADYWTRDCSQGLKICEEIAVEMQRH
ncbi:MAG: cobalamin-dependent protein [Clostridiales bacterium]|nr:cobalamin-dependent protein [Eubacteriales bacterium]MDH7566285.1 cobalamin-dependent protein [Clostridiales bacterium]